MALERIGDPRVAPRRAAVTGGDPEDLAVLALLRSTGEGPTAAAEEMRADETLPAAAISARIGP